MKISIQEFRIVIDLETPEELKTLGVKGGLEGLYDLDFEGELSYDAERMPVSVTKSKYPAGIFIRVKEQNSRI